jgi:catechol 2,3-dioxygenase-like lactoylglutathione lyase family enzyme
MERGESQPMGMGHAAPRVDSCDLEDFGFSHLVLEVGDLDKSETFYRDVVGLDLLGRGLMAESRPHALLRMNTGQLLVLLEVENPEPYRQNSASIHHAFWLTMDQYRAAQVRFDSAGFDIGDERAAFRAKGEYSMDIWDPDGHHWQVQTEGPEATELIKPGVGVVDCGPAEKYPVGSITSFGEGNFFLIREPAGFLALSRWCRHRNGILANQAEHCRFFCNFHGATYDYAGIHTGHMRGIPPLRANPVTVTPEGKVLVDTDTVIERAMDEPPAYVPVPEPARR